MKLFWYLSLISFLISLVPPYALDAINGKSVELKWIPTLKEDNNSWNYWLFVVSWNCFNLGLIQIISRWKSIDNHTWRVDFINSILLYGWYCLWNMTMLKLTHSEYTIYFFLGGGLSWNIMNAYHISKVNMNSFKYSVILSSIINIINITAYFLKYCDSCDYADWYWVNTLFQYIFAASMLFTSWFYCYQWDSMKDIVNIVDIEAREVYQPKLNQVYKRDILKRESIHKSKIDGDDF